ncbi:MAG: 16S rRNA (uracil(1498)-N(3))-methyltransferase [Pirellulales bacterium]|nr:16S rRNA (uracil(1498)-N(3))-methyltransferase [Pirellulales bacterium]
MADRYFASDPIRGDEALLTGPEAHHLSHVMRAKPGDRVTVFDGSGNEFSTEVRQVGRSEVRLRVVEARAVDRELPFALTLAVALPKGERQRWLVEKATELGVGRLVPIQTERSVVLPGVKAVERLGRAVIEASKQCGRNRLMEIAPPCAWSELIETTNDVPLRVLADPSGETLAAECLAGELPETILLAIGPEGGFTPEELALAQSSGWQIATLGPRILRIETAAVALATLAAMRP